MFITAAPSLNPLDLILPSRHRRGFPGMSERTAFFSRGCGAIRALLASLALAPGETILVPTYLCGEVVDTFQAARVPMALYAVDDRAQFDLAVLASRITPRTRAIYVVHYFGFPQDVRAVRALADERGVLLIEDCAHALFGRSEDDWLGAIGHAAIFSLRKTLPLPDGGALVVRHPVPAPPVPTERIPLARTVMSLGRLAAKAALFGLQWRPGIGRGTAPGAHAPAGDPDVYSSLDSRAMSTVARHLYSRADVASITEQRRANYRFYLARLGAAALYPRLPEGVVPFSFPMQVDHRDRMVAKLARAGLSVNLGFPEAPAAAGADAPGVDLDGARHLAARVLELPVHQDLRLTHLERVVAELNRVA